ncbi:methionine aminopeptidase [Candidatus Phycorickettsia trachydisci]|uniref:Methionine aminopeptidase n=1 Tax=Candidatus Phycorickettsia trachydisci TaxID=2115978 RepID=A0A2P1P8T6_9RICK|nr:type I methionyl aminopeptidase [Candidatus Phycorickettsia trachydisci]AVP87682.1 methionine aminopeptidase [Candidatus Phycorickettsia trachydisci]
MKIRSYGPEGFNGMRAAGKLAAEVLDYITDYVKEGVTTNYLNDLCHKFIVDHGAIPAPLNYKGFPKSICTSLNHVVCHGIPSDRVLINGDILNIDVTVILDGWHGDTSRMFYVGSPSVKAKRLVEATYEAMLLGIEQVSPGARFGDIGYAIQSYIEKQKFSVVRDFVGHGIGRRFHEAPNVFHFGQKGTGPIMEEGMFFTIEPMINAGSYETIVSKVDGWTAMTKDRSLSAQFEHTVAVTSAGYEIFTLSPKGLHAPVL